MSPLSVWASACCGGAFSIPAIITGDDQAQVSTSVSRGRIHADVSDGGLWRKRKAQDVTEVFKIEAAHIFLDRWQSGFSLPVQTRTKEGAQGGTSSGLGDVALQVGYEYLPDWDYNPLRPKGVGFLTLTLPTGKSLEEALQEDGGLSARGQGLWSVGAGTVLTKIHKAWDLSTSLEVHRPLAKASISGARTPEEGGSFGFGGGWNTQFARIGGTLSWHQEDGGRQRYTTATLSTSYIFPENWAGTLSYSDQTLFGNPRTTALSQSVLFLVQKRWNR